MTSEESCTPSILVVDDTPENLRLLVELLEDEGYDVRPVTDGAQALRAARSATPDLVLLDVTMPGMDGFEVCAELATDEATKDIPVIFLSGLGEATEKARAFETGAVDYITKPFEIGEVLARVHTHLSLQETRRRLAERLERLRRLEGLRDDLVSMVIHDMRSPLMNALGRLELTLLAAPGELPAEARVNLESAQESVAQIVRMANDLLDVRRIEAAAMPLAPTEVDLGELVWTCSATITGGPGHGEIEVDPEAVVEGDKGLLRRVVENLLTNAVHHADQRVAVRVRTLEDRVRVEIEDDGAGVPVEAREAIFEKFQSLGARKAHEYHSTGLGLTFCRLAVERHGGSIGVGDREPRGSCFWFEVPKQLAPS